MAEHLGDIDSLAHIRTRWLRFACSAASTIVAACSGSTTTSSRPSRSAADAVLVDGLKDLDVVRDLVRSVDRPFCFNQIAGGKSPPYTQNELREAGISLVIYSTPCLFAAQAAMEDAMLDLKARNGTLAGSRVGVKDCTAILQDNLARRNERS